MAEHGAAPDYGTATGNDFAEHARTYEGFVGATKYIVIAIVILLLLMAFFLV